MNFTITDAENGLTIKQYLERLKLSARLIASLKAKEKGITVNGERKTVRWVLKTGDLLSLQTEDLHSSEGIKPSYIPIKVIYEDEWFIAVEKPAHLPIHPSRRHTEDTLAARVMAHFEGQNFIFRVLTRLDIDTSGVVLIAKDSISAARFSKMLADRKVTKEYIAICEGAFESDSGTIDYNIRRVEQYKMEREAVPKGIGHGEDSPEGNEAVSEYAVIKRNEKATLVRFSLITGRTHQLRVHSLAIGHPIISDTLYHKASPYIDRQALHAETISFVHPMTDENVTVICPIPEDMAKCEREIFGE